MRFSIERANLVRALSHLSGVYASRNTIAIANNVLIEAHDGKAVFTANNYSQSMSVTVAGTAEKGGAATIEYQKLKGIADTTPEGAQVTIEYDEEAEIATVRAGRGRYKLFSLPARDFPVFEFPENVTAFELYGAELETLLAVGHAAANDDQRHYLSGIYLHRDGKDLIAVATDTHRISLAETRFPDADEDAEVAAEIGVIVPLASVKILRGLVSDDIAALRTDGLKLAVTFERGGVTIRFATKLVEGTYPEYRRLIPARGKTSFTVTTERMLTAIKRATIIQNGGSSAVQISLTEGKVAVSARGDNGMEAVDEVDCDWAEGEETFTFNARYLVSALANMNVEEVEFVKCDHGGRAVIAIEIPGDASRREVIAQQGGRQ